MPKSAEYHFYRLLREAVIRLYKIKRGRQIVTAPNLLLFGIGPSLFPNCAHRNSLGPGKGEVWNEFPRDRHRCEGGDCLGTLKVETVNVTAISFADQFQIADPRARDGVTCHRPPAAPGSLPIHYRPKVELQFPFKIN